MEAREGCPSSSLGGAPGGNAVKEGGRKARVEAMECGELAPSLRAGAVPCRKEGIRLVLSAAEAEGSTAIDAAEGVLPWPSFMHGCRAASPTPGRRRRGGTDNEEEVRGEVPLVVCETPWVSAFGLGAVKVPPLPFRSPPGSRIEEWREERLKNGIL